MSLTLAAAILAMSMPTQADRANENARGQLQVLPVARTPESNTVVLAIAIPGRGDLLDDNPVWIQFRLDGYSLGSGSQFDRADEIPVSDMGQTVHVVIDNMPYIAINEPAINPFNEEGFYYNTHYKFELPFSLKDGMHTIRMFPARSYGESLKGENTFRASYFYLGDRTGNAVVELDKPYITYNEPSDQIPLSASLPVLLDFYVSNCELTADGYKIRLSIDGKVNRTLVSWQPYYIYGLNKGKHNIRLELLDAKGKLVSGAFNDIQRAINISD